MSAQPNWLQEWWEQSNLDRRAMLYPDQTDMVPAYPWLPDGTDYELLGHRIPISFVAAACGRRFPVLINLDALRRSVLAALAGKPDTRTHWQRRHDEWLALQEKYDAQQRREAEGSETEAGGGSPSTGAVGEG